MGCQFKLLILLSIFATDSYRLQAQDRLPFKAEGIKCGQTTPAGTFKAGVVITLDDTFVIG